MTASVLLLLAAYLVGSTPTSHWVALGIYGKDLRSEGSGNLGATNTFRVLGWKAALPVLAFDVLKGWGPAALFPLVSEGGAQWGVGYGAAAILGHVFSFWVGLKGGKGVATSSGVFLALAPGALLVGLGVWMLAVFSTGYVSLGSVLAALVLPIAVFFLPGPGGPAVLLFSVALGAFVLWAHRGNIRRLLKGEERRFGRRAA